MSLIDDLTIGIVLILALARPFARGPVGKVWWLGLAVAATLMLAQLSLEGFYWQFLSSYLLLAIITVFASSRRALPGPFVRFASRCGLGLLILATAAPWVLLPVPVLTSPQGPYAVGSEIFRWVDPNRPETATPDPDDRRNVIVQAWYPALATAQGPRAPYIDGLSQLPSQVSVFPSFVMSAYGKIDTHGILDAPLSDAHRLWPTVVFSPGLGAPRAFYTSLVTGLASRGYVVLALDHPYDAAVTQLANGQVVSTREEPAASGAERSAMMAERQTLRANDVSFVLDQVGRPGLLGPHLSGHLDMDHIAAVGHSFGGATAALAMARDQRIKAAANIDGTLYGDLPMQRLKRPLLLLESDHVETGHSQAFLTGNQTLLDRLQGGGFRYQISRANHFSFTDAPLFFSVPGRFALTWVVGGARGASHTHRITADILSTFLQGPLGGEQGDLAVTASRYPDVVGGRVSGGS